MDTAGVEGRCELRPNPSRPVVAVDHATIVRGLATEAEYLLHGDDIALHAGDLLEAHESAPAVRHALELEHHMDCRGDLCPDGADRHLEAGHADHLLEARQSV